MKSHKYLFMFAKEALRAMYNSSKRKYYVSAGKMRLVSMRIWQSSSDPIYYRSFNLVLSEMSKKKQEVATTPGVEPGIS